VDNSRDVYPEVAAYLCLRGGSGAQWSHWRGDVQLLGACVLGDGLGALRDGVLGQLTRKQQAHGCLNLPGGDGGALVVMGQAGGFSSDALEDVVDEGVHDAHGLGGDASVGVDLLQHLVDVDGVALFPALVPLLITLLLGLRHGFLGALFGGRGGLRWLWHPESSFSGSWSCLERT